jgi:hypothetical protein
MAEAKKGFKARVEAELSAGKLRSNPFAQTKSNPSVPWLAAGGENLSEMKATFSSEERAIEHQIDHEVHNFSATVDVAYNVRSNSLTAHTHLHLTLLRFARAVPLAVSTRGRAKRSNVRCKCVCASLCVRV